MEKRIITYDLKKAYIKLILGVLIIASGFLFRIVPYWFVISFFIGGSFIYFSLPSISSLPQLVFSEEGLYIGFKMNKLLSWQSIKRIEIRSKSVDFRTVHFIVVVWTFKTNAPTNTIVREFPIENLNITIAELEQLIEYYTKDVTHSQF